MINVTKTFLPPVEEYMSILKEAWDKTWITNQGTLAQRLEGELKKFLNVNNILLTANGTVVLQMALKALKIKKEVITTPFSYVATTNAILWENCTPVFADIDPDTYCIDAETINSLITENTQAIMATHVYGIPCDTAAIKKIADAHNIKVIYDAAHAFGVTYQGRSLLEHGDISTCSFHATKVFHTVEGGCIITDNEEIFRQLYLMRSFGHVLDDYYNVGINAKNSEFHSAMGLAVLPYIHELIAKRKRIFERYVHILGDTELKLLSLKAPGLEYNYAYFPVVFPDEETMLRVKKVLAKNSITPRRYFYPSLNTLPFLNDNYPCPVSEDISPRILCLPLYPDLSPDDADRIAELVIGNVN